MLFYVIYNDEINIERINKDEGIRYWFLLIQLDPILSNAIRITPSDLPKSDIMLLLHSYVCFGKRKLLF